VAHSGCEARRVLCNSRLPQLLLCTKMLSLKAAAALSVVALTRGATTSGEVTSTACPNYSTCSTSGSSAYARSNLVLNTTTGKFTGTVVTNQCPGVSFTGSVREHEF